MKKIEQIKLIEACNAKEYQARLNEAVAELQALNLAVTVKHSMSQAQKGVGYMYSAVVLGGQE